MKRLTLAAGAAALMLAVAPQLHAQAQQGKQDTTKKAAVTKSATKSSASAKSASTKTASAKSHKARKSSKAKTDTTAKKSE